MSRVAVVGAGVTGLAAAWRFLNADFEVTIFDAADRVGGRVGSTEFSGRLVDTGPDALGPDPALQELLDQVGMADQIEIPDPAQAFRLTASGELEPFGVGGGVMFGLAGGIFSLPARLEELLRSKVRFQLGSEIEQVEVGPDQVRLAWGGETEEFDAVLLATGAAAAAGLLGGEAGAHLGQIEGLSVSLVHLAIPATQIGREMDGTGYLADPKDGRLVTGCSWSSVKWERLKGDPVILRASIREAGQGEVVHLPDQEIVDLVLAELKPVMAFEGEPVESLVTRYPNALVSRDEQHEQRVAAARATLKTSPRIGLAGADLDGPGIARSLGGVQRTVDSIIEGITNE